MSAAEDQDADSEENGKFDSLKQYPFLDILLLMHSLERTFKVKACDYHK